MFPPPVGRLHPAVAIVLRRRAVFNGYLITNRSPPAPWLRADVNLACADLNI